MRTLRDRSVRWFGLSDGVRKLSPMVRALPIVAVFGLNLLILAYVAVRISPPEAAAVSSAPRRADNTGRATENTAVFDIEDDQWTMEPLRVVNVF